MALKEKAFELINCANDKGRLDQCSKMHIILK